MADAPVLYVEDEEVDVLLMRLGFERAGIADRLAVVTDGQAAIDYLAGAGPYANREQHPLPCMVLLDLKLPRRSGFEVLRWIREHPKLKTVPVAILTSSGHERDLEQAEAIGVEDYIVKKAKIAQIAELAQNLKARWLD